MVVDNLICSILACCVGTNLSAADSIDIFIFASDFREKKVVVLLLLKGEILWED